MGRDWLLVAIVSLSVLGSALIMQMLTAAVRSGRINSAPIQDPTTAAKLAEAQAALQVVQAINAQLCHALAARAVNDAVEAMRPQAAAVARAKTNGSTEKLQ